MYSNESVRRAFAILETLCDHPAGLTISEVAENASLHRATAHRLLEVLRALGYVTKSTTSKRYSVGFRMGRFGNKPLIVQRVLNRSRHRLRLLANEFKAIAVLGSLHGFHAVTAEQFKGIDAVIPDDGLPQICDAHVSAFGKALLSLQSPGYVLRGLQTIQLARHTANSLIQTKALQRDLAVSDERGFALDQEEMIEGFSGIGVPLINPAGRATCALALYLPSHNMERAGVGVIARRIQTVRDDIVAEIVDRAGAMVETDASAEPIPM